ncbi:MAG TPA: lactate utilization protein C, partial [Anaerolineales bacterium]|nr:lactate utilization protein C [Anaerolineales bacterium]
WDDGALPDGLADALRAGGITIYNDPQPQIRVGISGAVAGIAETGTLVIPSGVGKIQSASLLPETHLAILRAADILPRMVDALKRPELRTAAAVALVSGPSRTADIEMTLTIGVHGPGEVFVFCV